MFRAAEPGDAAAIAAFHVAVWRQAYAGIAPAEAVAALDVSRRRAMWAATLSAPVLGQGCVLAVAGHEIAGLVAYGPASDPVFEGRGEVKHLYVGAAHRHLGLARALLARARADLAAAGMPRVGLAVVAQNAGARAAYARMGGVEAGGFTDAGPLWRSDNILVVWDDLRARWGAV